MLLTVQTSVADPNTDPPDPMFLGLLDRSADPDPDPDPHQNVMDPQHWYKRLHATTDRAAN
jgi:hypothetical protein